jgi:uncharacterized membrane protein
MNFLNFCLIILQVTINSVAQVLLKKGVVFLNFKQPIFPLFFSVITNWYIVGGATIFVLSLILWLYLLSQFDLSFLYPISSLAFVITAVSGWMFLSENISLNRGMGIVLIIMGVMFIAKS